MSSPQAPALHRGANRVMDVQRAARSVAANERTCDMADQRRCIGSARFGIEAHEAPVADFPVQLSHKDGLGRMCKVHWNAYTAGLARDANPASRPSPAASRRPRGQSPNPAGWRPGRRARQRSRSPRLPTRATSSVPEPDPQAPGAIPGFDECSVEVEHWAVSDQLSLLQQLGFALRHISVAHISRRRGLVVPFDRGERECVSFRGVGRKRLRHRSSH